MGNAKIIIELMREDNKPLKLAFVQVKETKGTTTVAA